MGGLREVAQMKRFSRRLVCEYREVRTSWGYEMDGSKIILLKKGHPANLALPNQPAPPILPNAHQVDQSQPRVIPTAESRPSENT